MSILTIDIDYKKLIESLIDNTHSVDLSEERFESDYHISKGIVFKRGGKTIFWKGVSFETNKGYKEPDYNELYKDALGFLLNMQLQELSK